MVGVARFFMEFCRDESCGKCIPCRAGTVQMHQLLQRIGDGEGTARRSGTPRVALRHGQAHEPLRARPVRAEPRAEHLAVLPARVRELDPGQGRRQPSPSGRCARHWILIGGDDHVGIVRFTIDGKLVSAARAQTILEAARDAGSRSRRSATSTACPTSAPAGFAWSRSAGIRPSKLLPACVTKVAEEMEVQTDTERLREYRRMIVELLFAERNHVCSVCVANGHCELQDLAVRPRHGPRPLRVSEPAVRGGCQPRALRDRSQPLHPLHALRPGLRRDRRGAHLGRRRAAARNARLITDMNQPWGDVRRPAPRAASA